MSELTGKIRKMETTFHDLFVSNDLFLKREQEQEQRDLIESLRANQAQLPAILVRKEQGHEVCEKLAGQLLIQDKACAERPVIADLTYRLACAVQNRDRELSVHNGEVTRIKKAIAAISAPLIREITNQFLSIRNGLPALKRFEIINRWKADNDVKHVDFRCNFESVNAAHCLCDDAIKTIQGMKYTSLAGIRAARDEFEQKLREVDMSVMHTGNCTAEWAELVNPKPEPRRD